MDSYAGVRGNPTQIDSKKLAVKLRTLVLCTPHEHVV
jgi:hypothetical protein